MLKTFFSNLSKKISKSLTLTFISASFLFIFFVSMILTYGPIFVVEVQYQYHSLLHTVFHVSDLRGLIFPQFHFDFGPRSKYPEFGMKIDTLYLDEPIIPNVDPNNRTQYLQALKKGIAQAAGTQLPGNIGLGYYFAHSSQPDFVNQYNAVFYLLGKLQPGNEVDLWYHGQKYAYTVTQKKETAANDLSFLQKTYTKEEIVLQTCWPPGTTQRRLLIFAERK